MATTLYPKLSQPPPAGIVLPVAQYSIPSGPFYLLDTTAPAGPQQSLGQIYTNLTGDAQGTWLTFCSSPLLAGPIGAGGWTSGLGWSSSGTSHSGGRSPGDFGGAVYVYLVNGSTGVVRTQLAAMGAGGTTSGNFGELTTGPSSTTGTAYTAVAGDYLALVVGVIDASSGYVGGVYTGGTVSGTVTWYTDGTAPITTIGVPTSSAQSFLTAPVTLAFKTPVPATIRMVGGGVMRLATGLRNTRVPATLRMVGGGVMHLAAAAVPVAYEGPQWSASAYLGAPTLDTAVPTQAAYLQSGGIPTAATGLSLTQPATAAVLLPTSGAPPVGVQVAATTVPCGSGSAAQDNYVDLTPAGTYTVTTVASGAAPSAPAAGTLRLYRARTNSTNTAVALPVTALAPTHPALFVGQDGSNAGPALALAGGLTAGVPANTSATSQILPGLTTLSGDLLLGGLVRQGPTPGGQSPNGVAWQLGSGLVITGEVSSTGPAGVVTFTTPATLSGGPPYHILDAVGMYSLGNTSIFAPSGPRAGPVMTGFLLAEVGTQTSQPGLWMDSLTTETVTPSGGDGPSSQTYSKAAIWAASLAPSTTYSFVYLPSFG